MKTAQPTETYEWLTARNRAGARRIQVLSWTRLAGIYRAHQPNSPVRRAINREALRLGYTPRVILGLHS